ncbi:unnamed protein product [Eruca vesicaria subsp. sativa]|uniref:Uncharacterized protein n=1 Tax=Eruca vesicaria subsp. sativa TaxID=29727 RepID=A0ABC8JK88_ERUVS|nr:unnamed protein product [Eruca vesicaria subsp. sativa]
MTILGASSSGTANRSRQTRLPPGATRPATSAASRHPLPSLAAVMSAPERRNMPLLHPQRLNGGLWFGIDDCIRKDVVSTYQSNFWGPWWNYGMVPAEKKAAWWTCFVVATNGKGRVYGLGSIQDIENEDTETAPASLFTHVGFDARLTTVEGIVTGVKEDVTVLKDGFSAVKRGIELLMKMNGVDPITGEPLQRESNASVPSPQSSQELNQNSPSPTQ